MASESAASASAATAATGTDDDIAALLTDYRLVRANGPLVSSVVVGMVAPYLSWCCEDPWCPYNRDDADDDAECAAAATPRVFNVM